MSGRHIVYAIAGNDSGGGAGLSADARAAEAAGVHLCPVIAAITVQNTCGVRRVVATKPELLAAQLDALADDMPPAVIKTGVLGSAANVRVVAAFVRRLRQQGHVALVVDPILRASSGDDLSDAQALRSSDGLGGEDSNQGNSAAELLHALRCELLPLADVITPNAHEAALLLGVQMPVHAHTHAPTSVHTNGTQSQIDIPAAACALQAMGAGTVCITGGDAADTDWAQDYFCSPHASGWLRLPRVQTTNTHGTGCSFATTVAAALARGFVSADALVLAKMAVAASLQADAHQASPGAGPGPVRVSVRAAHGFLPELGGDDFSVAALFANKHGAHQQDQDLRKAHPARRIGNDSTDVRLADHNDALAFCVSPEEATPSDQALRGVDVPATRAIGVYPIVDSLERLEQVLHQSRCMPQAATMTSAKSPFVARCLPTTMTLQLRIKTAAGDAARQLRPTLAAAIALARQASATLYINDHWQLALELGADAIHLGQEDLLALTIEEQQQLRAAQARGLQLGISSHSLWELCRAKAWQPSYIACGPVWPTTTKNMPWQPQGLHNLAWWCAAAAPIPVVAIGGILSLDQATAAARRGAQAVCLVRGLGDEAHNNMAAFNTAWALGWAGFQPDAAQTPHWPLPGLGQFE
jgi:hydroxymethylpyrimidine kinase / phosphomethylpyrimidine kinase / thiamine-phosphate diphosphorylase